MLKHLFVITLTVLASSAQSHNCATLFNQLSDTSLLKGFRGGSSQLRAYISLFPRVRESQLAYEIAEAIPKQRPFGIWRLKNEEIVIAGSVAVRGTRLHLNITELYSFHRSGLTLFLPQVMLGLSAGVQQVIECLPQVNQVRIGAWLVHNKKVGERLQKWGFEKPIKDLDNWQELVLRRPSRFWPAQWFR